MQTEQQYLEKPTKLVCAKKTVKNLTSSSTPVGADEV